MTNNGGPVGLGLVGCGRAVERLYLPALAGTRGGRVAAVTDVSAERRTLIAEALDGAKTYESLEPMLADESVEAIVIATPPQTHVPLARQALEAGRKVLIEKPLAPTVAEAETLREIDGADESVMVAFNRRRWEPIEPLRRLMERRDRSEPVSVDTVLTNDIGGWAPVTGIIDPLDDLAAHHLDLLQHIFGPIRSIRAERPDERTIRLEVRLDGNVTAHCLHAQGDAVREHLFVQTNGRRHELLMGSTRLGPPRGALRSLLDAAQRIPRKLMGMKTTLTPTYVRQFEHFCQCVRDNTQPQPSLADGINVIRAVEAARMSVAQDGQEVSIDG